MDWKLLDELGHTLRQLGHARHDAVLKIRKEATQHDPNEAATQLKELISYTDSSIELMQKQRDLLQKEVSQLEGS